jgi:NNP family nitrate/nitrite transporter-like MFS transporter
LAYASGDYGGRLPGKAPSLASWRPILKDRSFWIMMLLFSLGIGGSFGVFTMLPLFLINVHGLERSWANTLISLSRISGIGAAFLAGWAVDRAGPKRTLQSVLFFTGLATLGLGVTSGWMLMAAVFLQPLLAVSFFPAGFAALSRLSSESERNVAVSLTIPAAYTIGAGIIPFFIGAMADAGAFSAGIAGVGGLFLSGALLPGFVGGMDPRER